MQKIVLTFGIISGVLMSVLMIGSLQLQNKIGDDHGSLAYVIGYTTIVLSLLLVFFGIRSYRDEVGGGQITFGRGFAVGICITLITCVFYVVVWEIVYFNFMHNFMDNYAAHAIDKARASGASADAIQKLTKSMQQMKVLYENPLYNAAFTFIEPFPVGVLVTLLSAAILRRKAVTPALQTAI